jgi:uncharacterized protein YozE (UPF0346 family)
MSALDKQPENLNYLSPLGFRFILDRTPTTNYFVQLTSLPSITLGDFDEATPLVNLPYPGDKLRFNPFDITFRVDEDMRNYKEIYDWLIGLGYPESTDQRAVFANQARGTNLSGGTGKDAVYSDASLIIMTSAQNPNVRINFRDCFPIDLSTLQFNTTSQDVNYLEASATFRYSLYTIDLI